jgi:hypothetical protein
MHEILWWTLYTLCGIWIQDAISGVDCFGPGLLLCLQTERSKSLVWLAPIWVLLQEGTGSLPFGSALLYYAGLIYFFLLIRPYINITSPMYILSVALFAGLWHFGVVHLVSALQDIHILSRQILTQSVRITAVFPVIWALASLIYYFRIAPRHARF